MRKILILVFSLCLFCLPGKAYALGTATVNGLAVTDIETDGIIGKSISQFNSYALGTANTYVYNDVGSTTNTAGSYKVLPYEFKTTCYDITGLQDLGSTTIGIFYANGTTTIWSTISETVYSGTASGKILISDYPEFIRFGIKRSDIGTKTINVTLKHIYYRIRN